MGRQVRTRGRQSEASVRKIEEPTSELKRKKEHNGNGDGTGWAGGSSRGVQYAGHGRGILQKRQSNICCLEEREGVPSNLLRREVSVCVRANRPPVAFLLFACSPFSPCFWLYPFPFPSPA